MKNLKRFILSISLLAGANYAIAQTTINLADQCNCEVFTSSTEVTAGATAPAGAKVGNLLVDPSGDIFFWDGDSWELSSGKYTEPWFGTDNNAGATSNTESIYHLGRVGLGTTNPTQRLDIDGQLRVRTIPIGVTSDSIVTANVNGNIRKRSSQDIVNEGLAGGANPNDNHLGDVNQILSGNRIINANSFNLTLASPSTGSNADGLIMNKAYLNFLGVDNTDASCIYGLENGLALSSFGYTLNTIGGGVNEPELFLNQNSVGIGTRTLTEKLTVNGNIKASGNLQSGTTTYPDYVFETYSEGKSDLNRNYEFKSLEEVESFIKINKHLPGVKSIKELEKTKDGKYNVDITATSMQTLEKVEELFLHTINQEKKIESLTRELAELKAQMLDIMGLIQKK